MIQMYRQIDIDTQIDRYIGRQNDTTATFFCPCTKDYIFAPMDDDRPCFIKYFLF